MKHLRSLAVLLLVSVASCAVESDEVDESTSPALETASMPQSLAAPLVPELQPIRPAACDQIWQCRRCGVNSRQNVLVEVCDDGTRTIIEAGPCGQPCF